MIINIFKVNSSSFFADTDDKYALQCGKNWFPLSQQAVKSEKTPVLKIKSGKWQNPIFNCISAQFYPYTKFLVSNKITLYWEYF